MAFGNLPPPPSLPYTPVQVAHPHAPTSICGTAVTYDANGNTLSYDVDGAGLIQPRAITYDGENRPISVTQNANTSKFAYGPDGERALKNFGSSTSYYLGSEAELLIDTSNPSGLLTSYLHPDVKRQGAATTLCSKITWPPTGCSSALRHPPRRTLTMAPMASRSLQMAHNPSMAELNDRAETFLKVATRTRRYCNQRSRTANIAEPSGGPRVELSPLAII